MADQIIVLNRGSIRETGATATVLYQQHNRGYRYTEAHNDYLQLAAEGGILLTVPAAACVVDSLYALGVSANDDSPTAIATTTTMMMLHAHEYGQRNLTRRIFVWHIVVPITPKELRDRSGTSTSAPPSSSFTYGITRSITQDCRG